METGHQTAVLSKMTHCSITSFSYFNYFLPWILYYTHEFIISFLNSFFHYFKLWFSFILYVLSDLKLQLSEQVLRCAMVAKTEMSILPFTLWKIVSFKVEIRKPLHPLASPAPNSILQKPKGLSKHRKTVQTFLSEHCSMVYPTIISSTPHLFLREIWKAHTIIVRFYSYLFWFHLDP